MLSMQLFCIPNDDAFVKYREKIKNIKIDPYLLDNYVNVKWCRNEIDNFKGPPIEEIDIHDYFINRTSTFSYEQFKARKSLLAYNYFVSGKVHNVRWIKRSDFFLVKSEVEHSMKRNDRDLNVWMEISLSGKIVCGHCSCMAGLAESCSHLAAVAYYFNYFNKNRNETIVTDVKAYWATGSCSKKVKLSPKKIDDIDYTTAENLFTKNEMKNDSYKEIKVKDLVTKLPDNFFETLFNIHKKATILRVIKPFCDELKKKIPFPLVYNTLYESKYEDFDLEKLIDTGKQMQFTLTPANISEIACLSKN